MEKNLVHLVISVHCVRHDPRLEESVVRRTFADEPAAI